MTTDDTRTKVTAWVPVCDEMFLDAGWWPWRLPDPNPMPNIEISPHLERALEMWDEARFRVHMAWHVLRHGYDTTEETDQ